MISVYVKYHALAAEERNVSSVINKGHIQGERGDEKEPLEMLNQHILSGF